MTAMRPPQCEQRAPTPALGAALLLAVACAVGPDYERPALPVTQTYRDWPTQMESIADLAWWQVFRDEALERLIREALGNNRDLAAATERVEQARYLAGVQRGELFPDLGYEGDAARGRDTQFGAPVQNRGVESDYLGAATAFWELDVWGRLRRASEAARAEMLATEAFRRGVVLSLAAGVAQAYFELLELDLELEIARRNVQSFTETRDLFQRQFQGGIASRLDPLRGEAALAQVASTVPELERRIVEKENELSVLIGAPPGPIARGLALTAQTMPPEVPAGVPAQLLERRPDLIEAEERLVATNALVGVAFSDFFPRIELTAFGGTVSNELEDAMSADASGIWSILGSAIGPVFTFGRVWYGWRAAERDASAARANYERAVLNALREVSNALVARAKLALVRLERERAVEALSEALRTARTRYMGGRATYLEVLDAQQQLFPAENDLARTRRDELLALVALNRALAGGWKQEPEAPAVPGPLAP
jgi:multidrug efflux system outer membrane protein